MTGRKSFVAKVMGLVVSKDRMIGGQFEQGGRARLREAAGAARPSGGAQRSARG